MDPNARRAGARRLRLLILDVDGVLTDGCLHYGPEGEMLKVFHVRDGHGLKQLARAGVQLAIITGRNSAMVDQRAREIGIEQVIQGREDKGAAAADLAAELGLEAETVGYVGDDEPDVPAMEWAGLAFTVADAHESARAVADYVATRGGGRGAVREICDFVRAAIERTAAP
jgi:3-deoxy-D-manno-octulosonate 8-phosphate phosphatase (KDO 8-P phosphatase)